MLLRKVLGIAKIYEKKNSFILNCETGVSVTIYQIKVRLIPNTPKTTRKSSFGDENRRKHNQCYHVKNRNALGGQTADETVKNCRSETGVELDKYRILKVWEGVGRLT